MMSSILNKFLHLFRYRFKIVEKRFNDNRYRYCIYYKAWYEIAWNFYGSEPYLSEAKEALYGLKEKLMPKKEVHEIVYKE